MGWVQQGRVMDDDGQHSEEQVGNAASVRFVHTDMPGRLVTVYAYPVGVVTPSENGDQVECAGIDTHTEYMICRDLDDPGGTEEFSQVMYETLDTKPFSHVGLAENVALAWVIAFDADRNIHWDGNPF